DGGTSWTSMTSGLTSTWLASLTIAPSAPSTLYAGSFGVGVFTSTNGATSWQPTCASLCDGSPATVLSKVIGDNQTGGVGRPLVYPLTAVITNAGGVPVAGVTVDFAVTGGGTLLESQSISDSQGVVFTKLTLGTAAGANIVTMTAAGLTGSPLTFT